MQIEGGPTSAPAPYRWAVVRGARAVATRFAASARGTPRAAWTAWLVALGAGFAGTALLMAALTRLARARVDAGLQVWDAQRLETIVASPRLSFQVAVWWEAFGASSMLIPVTVTAAVLAALARRPLLTSTLAAALLLAKPIILVGWSSWDRARPDLVAGGIAAPPLHSFPSGHSLQTAAIYGLLACLWARRSRSAAERLLIALLWIALVAIVGLARLRMGVHWPSDVLAGSAAGVAWLCALLWALRRAESRGGR